MGAELCLVIVWLVSVAVAVSVDRWLTGREHRPTVHPPPVITHPCDICWNPVQRGEECNNCGWVDRDTSEDNN